MTSRYLLELFYQAGAGYVPRAALGENATRLVAELEALGYGVEFHPHRGYRLLQSPDRLSADDIQARLRLQLIGTEILVFEQTTSTNDVVAHLAAAGAREGLVVFAESQTRGRGRHKRAWASPHRKGLWFSVLLRPPFPSSRFHRITIAASVAVVRALRRQTAFEPRIKWPNDITLNDRKLAGIITEVEGTAAVLGIGINVNCSAQDFPPDVAPLATSLAMESGRRHDRGALAAAVLCELDNCYRQLLADFHAIVTEWATNSSTLGRQIIVRVGRRRLEGCALALDEDGALLVRRDNGQIERLLSGDLEVQR
ncbi:MAG: biotin--[acetyl-CoA-carboxylase] ligase [Verrucomicrobiae bacterium]|nr:biotin--[acetyl-CoA-carboxylase] ligase [Verrucomicrobiae bacterium]